MTILNLKTKQNKNDLEIINKQTKKKSMKHKSRRAIKKSPQTNTPTNKHPQHPNKHTPQQTNKRANTPCRQTNIHTNNPSPQRTNNKQNYVGI